MNYANEYPLFLKDSETDAQKVFSELKLNQTHIAYIYGVGLGFMYEACIPWLKDDKTRSLVFLEDDPEAIRQLQQTERGKLLLNDPQVDVHLISEQLAELEHIILPYSVFSFTVSSLPAYARHRTRRFAELKAMIAFFSNYHRSSILGYAQGGLYFFNNYFNNILKLPYTYNAGALSGKFKDIPAIICGAGPSLDKNVGILRSLHDRALLFAGGTAINALHAKGVFPHFGVGIDPNQEQYTRLLINQGYETPFFYRNRINHRALDIIHGDKICVSGSSGFSVSNWMESQLQIKETHVSEGYNVLNFALSQAYAMGCNPIVIIGVDLAYSQGYSYASGIRSHPLHDRTVHFRTQSEDEEVLHKKDIYGEPVQTLWKWVREALWYGLFAEEHPDILLINATEGGIGFPGVRNQMLAEVAAQYLVKHFDMETKIHGEIQNSCWQPAIEKMKIRDLLRELSKGLKECSEICQQIETALTSPEKLNSDSESNPSNSIYQKRQSLESKDAFKAILHDLKDGYYRFTELETRRIEKGKKTMPEHEAASRKNTLDAACYALLKKAAHSNALLIDSILLDQKTPQETPNTHPNPSSTNDELTNPLKNECYAFDGRSLILRDPDLSLEYSEKFPSATYLRKEQQWYPEGMIKTVQFYQGIFLHGPSTFFSQTGNVLAKAWFLHGQQQGKMQTYFSSNQKHSIQSFKDGKKHGKQQFFYADGTKKTILNYRHGLLDGPVLLYHPNGQLARELSFDQGKHEGTERIWNEDGVLQVEVEYRQDHPIGKAKQWHPNGTLACEIMYDDRSHRVSAHYWNEEGVPIKEKERPISYLEALSKYADNLTHSLEDVFTKLSLMMPSVAKAPASPEDDTKQQAISQDLEDLQREMIRLQSLSEALQSESLSGNIVENSLHADHQIVFQQQLLEKHQQMADQMQSIDQNLKNLLTGILKKNEDGRK